MAITKSTERTKYELADAMKRCMKTAPVEKITVKEIVEACGVTRQADFGIRTSHGLLSIVGIFTIMMAGPRLANMVYNVTTATQKAITRYTLKL